MGKMVDLRKYGLIKKMAGKMRVEQFLNGNYLCWMAGPKKRDKNTVDFQVGQYFLNGTAFYFLRIFGNKIRMHEIIRTLNEEIDFENKNIVALSLKRKVKIRNKFYDFEVYCWVCGELDLGNHSFNSEYLRLAKMKKIDDFFI